MSICPSCGKDIQPGLDSCNNCGYKPGTPVTADAAPISPTASATTIVHAYRTPITLIGLVLVGVGMGIIGYPGYTQAIDGVILVAVGVVLLVYSSIWLSETSMARKPSAP